MRLPAAFSPLTKALSIHFADVLTPGQQRTLAAWVAGTLVAGSSCLPLVTAALSLSLGCGSFDRVRQTLKEWLLDGSERSTPSHLHVEPVRCFPALLAFVLSLWRSPTLALALDATAHTDQLTALVLSVLYRGRAIPIAWHIVPGNTKAPVLAPFLPLLDQLAPATAHLKLVTVAVDRGLWSPALADRLRRWHWQPLMRVQQDTQVWVGRHRHVAARTLVAGPGHAWVGRAVVHQHAPKRRLHTVLVVWDGGHAEPWVIFTDLPPREAGLLWYGLRMWIECGFRDLKRLGWQWERTRRRDPTRVSRHWLVLAVATIWTLATGTAVDPAGAADKPCPRALSVFQLGRFRLLGILLRTVKPTPLALLPEAWPTVPPDAMAVEYWVYPDAQPPPAVKGPL